MQVNTDVCIVGAGPAGMILGLLLAKVGIKVIVLETQPNFEREYRGEVLQPAFSQMMQQLNLKNYIYTQPHLKIKEGQIYNEGSKLGRFSFAELTKGLHETLWMPQKILLEALHNKAKTFSSYNLWFSATLKELIWEKKKVVGAKVNHSGENVEIRAKITVGADGRYSSVSRKGGFEKEYDFYKNDLIWFTMPRTSELDSNFSAILSRRHFYIILPKYPDQLQCGVFMPKGLWQELKSQNIDSFKEILNVPGKLFWHFTQQLNDFKAFHPLQSRIFYVKEWAKNGCLLVGDAAHCASPAGAIGVSLSVSTAIIAADVIYNALLQNDLSAETLNKVQIIRGPEIKYIHKLQIRAESFVDDHSFWKQQLRAFLLPLAFRLGIMPRVLSRIILLPKPLPISKVFKFID